MSIASRARREGVRHAISYLRQMASEFEQCPTLRSMVAAAHACQDAGDNLDIAITLDAFFEWWGSR